MNNTLLNKMIAKCPEWEHHTKDLGPDEMLFFEGESATTAYLVREGVLKVSRSSSNGREVITALYFPGEIVAGMSVLEGLEYMGTCGTPRQVGAKLTPISRSELLSASQKDSELLLQIMRTSREKQMFKDKMLLGLAAARCAQRAALALLWLAQHQVMRGNAMPMLLCRQEFADLIGATVETTIRTLSKFRRQGLVSEEEGLIHLNMPEISRLACA